MAIRLQVVVVHQPKESQAVCELQLRTIGRMDRMLKARDPAGKGCQKASPISHRECLGKAEDGWAEIVVGRACEPQ